jgi:predicted lipoprotein with Yx(FWY)xxD motif
MRRLITPLPPAALAVVAVVAAGCGGGGSSSTSSTPAYGAGGSAPTAGKVSVDLRRTSLGPVLVDASGRTLYLFEKDKGGKSTCNGACASVWPPVTAAGKVAAGPGTMAAKLGSAKQSDGTSVDTYAAHPLYTYVGDTKAGDVRGQGLDQFGAEWYALGASGHAVDE